MYHVCPCKVPTQEWVGRGQREKCGCHATPPLVAAGGRRGTLFVLIRSSNATGSPLSGLVAESCQQGEEVGVVRPLFVLPFHRW